MKWHHFHDANEMVQDAMAKKPYHGSAAELLPNFKITGNEIEIEPAPYRITDKREIDAILDDAEDGEYDLAYDMVTALLRKYPFDFNLINAYLLALHEINGADDALTFFEGKLQRFMRYLSEKLKKITGVGLISNYTLPFNIGGNKAFLQSIQDSGQFFIEEGRDAEAVDRFKQLLELDPGTNSNDARSTILHLAIKLDRLDDVPKISSINMPSSITSEMTDLELDELASITKMKFGWGLYFFLRGDQVSARRWFEAGIHQNANVVKFMFQGMQPVDEDTVNYELATGFYPPGGESEAIDYLDTWYDLWHQNPDVLGFLREISLDLKTHEELVFHLRISMKDVVPTISRLIAINSTNTFQELYHVICKSLDWSGSRKHEFVVLAKSPAIEGFQPTDKLKDLLSDERITIGMKEEAENGNAAYDENDDLEYTRESIEDDENEESEGDSDEMEDDNDDLAYDVLEPDYHEDEITLYEMFTKGDARASFTYDFDAYWDFDIIVEHTLPMGPNLREAAVLESQGMDPDENAGGPLRFMSKLLHGEIGTFTSDELKDIERQYKELLDAELQEMRETRDQIEHYSDEIINRQREQIARGNGKRKGDEADREDKGDDV